MLLLIYNQCLGSGSGLGSVGSARFWLPRSGSGSTDPDPRGKISTKNCKNKHLLLLLPKFELLKKRKIIKISLILNGSSSLRIKICEKNKTKNLKIIFC